MKFLDSLKKKLVKVGGVEYESLRLKDFFYLENLKIKLFNTIKKSDITEFIKLLNEIIFLQTKKTSPDNLYQALLVFIEIINQNKLDTEAVFLKSNPNDKTKADKNTWDYDGRFLAQWIHEFSKEYHWSLEEIFNLDINFASYLLQEILVEQQLRKEWTYSLTEFAYKYDKGSKTSTYVPLSRPFWMEKLSTAKIEKTKIPKAFLPHGVVVLSGIETPNAIEYRKE